MINEKKQISLILPLVVLPLILLAYFALSRFYAEYQFTQKELLGARYHGVVYSTMLNAQRLRGETYLNAGNHNEETNITSLKQKLQNGITLIDREHSIAEALNIQAQWSETKKILQSKLQQPLNLSPQEKFEEQSKAIKKIEDLLRQVSRNSNLILDPEIKSYDAMNLIVNTIPTMTSLLGYWRGKISGLKSTHQTFSNSDYKELIIAISRLEHLEEAYIPSDEDNQFTAKELQPEIQLLDTQILTLKQAASNNDIKDVYDYFNQITNAIEILHQAYKAHQLDLNKLLNQRSNLLIRYMLIETILILIAGFSCIWFIQKTKKNYNNQLKFSNELSATFDTVIDALIVINQHGIIQNVNLSARSIFGYPTGDMLYENIKKLVKFNGADLDSKYIKDSTNLNQLINFGSLQEAVGLRSDGTTFAAEFFSNKINTDTDTDTGKLIVCTVRDITNRKRAEEAQAEQTRGIEELLQSQSVATFVIDTNHNVVNWNHACETLTGLAYKDVVGTKDAWRGFYPTPRPCLADLVLDGNFHEAAKQYKVQGKSELVSSGWHAEAWFENLGGKSRYAIFDAVPMYDKYGKVYAVVETLQDLTKIKLIEQALADQKESALQVAKLLEHQKYALDEHAIVATTDAKGTITYVNDKFCAISGYSKDELLGKNHSLLNSGHHPKQFFTEMYAVIAKGNVWNAEICNRNKAGGIYWVNTTIVPFMGETGKPNEYIAIRNDITERKKASEALLIAAHKELESSQQIKALFDTVLDGLIVIDERGIIQTANPATTKIFGYSNEELIGQNVKMLMPDKQRSEHDGYIKNYKDTGDAKIIGKGREVVGRRKDGTIFAMDLGINETVIDGKRMFVGTTRDVSERRNIERLYRLMSENVEGYASVILDAQGIIKTWNSGAQALKGYTAEEIIGKPIETFYTEEDIAAQLTEKLLSTCIQEGHVHSEGWRVRKDGSQFYAEVVLNRLQDDDGSLLGFVKVTRDVTDRKQLDNDLKQAYSNLEEFTAVASHDLKSPLRGIADLVDWIKEDLGESIIDDVKSNLDRVQVRVKRMEALIDDLLQYSRAGKTSASISLVEPIALIEEVLEIQSLPAGFNVTITGSSPAFETAKTPLQTTLRNFISNAVKHHDKTEGNINIDVKTQGSFCIFTVQDDGPGIPESAQERIFKLFQTLSKTQESSGIGLAVSKRMVEAHGGYIKVESKAETRGTIFRIWWPKFNVNVMQDDA
jgi:PAS domain S-box-containing protein